MKSSDLILLYTNDDCIPMLKHWSSESSSTISLKNTQGSQLSCLVGAFANSNSNKTLCLVFDSKESAHYFHFDLKQLIGNQKSVLFFPSSYKKPFQYEAVENANIIQRAEVLSQISNNTSNAPIIVTYADAIAEKVINKKAFVSNAFHIRTNEVLTLTELEGFLQSFDFEKSDYVYEAGQYAIRGGIIDIFSYSNDYPIRIELFGNDVESIRTFHPETQLSIEPLNQVSISPNIQTKLIQERRENLCSLLNENAVVWIENEKNILNQIDLQFQKTEDHLNELKNNNDIESFFGETNQMVDSSTSFLKCIESFPKVYFGIDKHPSCTYSYTFDTKPQPPIHKEFQFLVEDLKLRINQGFKIIISAESFQQINRLRSILEELDPYIRFEDLLLSLHEGFVDLQNKIVLYTDHQLFDRFHRYKGKDKFSKSKSITLKELKLLQPGDYVTHVDYGVARFAGLERTENNDRVQENIRLVFKDNDIMTVSVHNLHKISRYSGKDGEAPVMSKLGTPEWENKKKKVKKQVKDIAKDLIALYAKRKAAPGFAYNPDSFLQTELESSFIYEDTPDQAKATADVKKDMEKPHPMDRLVCGDVGFGKTEIAIRAAFKAVCDNKQVAVLVPTTILAMQHYKTFKERLKSFPCVVEYVNRFKTAKQVKETLKRVEEGKTHILIGTHRVISKDVKFKNLGLLIIDEEQKFGVKVKDRLKEFKVNIDSLTLTATPIPRTLHFSLMGARDLSIIATPPPNRQPVTTEVHAFNEVLIRDAVASELERGGQVFFVHNRIKDIESIAYMIKKLVPDAKVTFAHGQMEGDQLEDVMLKFVDAEYDVLVSTNIIESGLDIPNANTIIINQAHMFGLSDLHQMRGRVGRSNKKAYCYLLTPSVGLANDSRKRLHVLEEFSDLGDGFKVAMRDLDIRGAGNLLGAEQSGFVTDIGFDMYHKILDEAIQELKENEFAALFQDELNIQNIKKFSKDCVIESDLTILIPESYVQNISERLSLYSTLDNVKNNEELDAFIKEITDRFGKIPQEVLDLIKTVEMRWVAEELGIEKIHLKSGGLKAQFVQEENKKFYDSETFGKIIGYIQSKSKLLKLKETNKKLLLLAEDIQSIDQALSLFQEMKIKCLNS